MKSFFLSVLSLSLSLSLWIPCIKGGLGQKINSNWNMEILLIHWREKGRSKFVCTLAVADRKTKWKLTAAHSVDFTERKGRKREREGEKEREREGEKERDWHILHWEREWKGHLILPGEFARLLFDGTFIQFDWKARIDVFLYIYIHTHNLGPRDSWREKKSKGEMGLLCESEWV